MKILYVTPEMVPFAKTGGLADVAGALPSAIARLGHEVKVVMPKYAEVGEERWGLELRDEFTVMLAGRIIPFTLWRGRLPHSPVEALFLGNDRLFRRDGLYQERGEDYPDNLERFSAFSRAVLDIPKRLNWIPDVLHANDWQTALIFAYLKAYFSGNSIFAKMGTVFTIHNLVYSGLFPGSQFSALDLPPHFFTPMTLEFYGKVNLLKAALVFAALLTTVSPTYSREILDPAFGVGLEGVLQARSGDLYGIVNGVDYKQWDPAHDLHLSRNYSSQDLRGKQACKRALQKECRFPARRVPLLAIVSRLTPQKGIDFILEELEELIQLDIQVVILGVGEPEIHNTLRKAAEEYTEKLSVHLMFDEPLAHRIMAGADLFLMPSRYEPCGLNQLYALRYGAVPVVRKTGGLADTVVDASPTNIASGKATGFVFEAASGHAFLTSIRLALCLFRDRPVWNRIVQAAMSSDFSWDRSAQDYCRLYEKALARAGAGGDAPSGAVESGLKRWP